RDRIRRCLVEARDALRLSSADALTGEMKTNEYLVSLLKEKDRAWRDVAAQRADTAVKSFDEAAISTIHSFCQRILRENAFEYGSLFNAELVTDQKEIIDEITRDFCRIKLIGGASAESVALIKDAVVDAGLERTLASTLSRPLAKLLPDTTVPPDDILSARRECNAAFAAACESWKKDGAVIEESLEKFSGWSKTFSSNISRRCGEMSQMLASDDHFSENFSDNNQLSYDFVQRQILKAAKDTFVFHPFFSLWQEYLNLRAQYDSSCAIFISGVRAEFVRFGKKELSKRKEARNIWSFDDLLSRVYDGLDGKNAERIIRTVRSRFSAALIDEFQDTDPLQCEIFQRIFNDPRSILFYIGDPKQAIYSFRGADIYAYVKAKKSISSHYSLDSNYRSSQRLLKSVNTLFGGAHPFLKDSGI
ncbi:MAG: UvrD-helicase domain-containing protein, partial [Spirochaetota bacterium]